MMLTLTFLTCNHAWLLHILVDIHVWNIFELWDCMSCKAWTWEKFVRWWLFVSFNRDIWHETRRRLFLIIQVDCCTERREGRLWSCSLHKLLGLLCKWFGSVKLMLGRFLNWSRTPRLVIFDFRWLNTAQLKVNKIEGLAFIYGSAFLHLHWRAWLLWRRCWQ